MKGTTIRRRFRAPRQLYTGCDKPKAVTTLQAPTRAARMLALAHHIKRLVNDGSIESYAEAAEALSLTRARMTQVMNLLMLSSEVQERIVRGEITLAEHSLRPASREPDWAVQSVALLESADRHSPITLLAIPLDVQESCRLRPVPAT